MGLQVADGRSVASLCGPFECPERGDAGEGHAPIGFRGPFLPFSCQGRTWTFLGSLPDPGLSDLAQFTEWSSSLADACLQVLALEEPQNLVAPAS